MRWAGSHAGGSQASSQARLGRRPACGSHACALPLQPGLDGKAGAAAEPAVEAGEGVEDPQRETQAERRRHTVTAGQDVEDRLVEAEAVARAHEEVEECRLVVLVDEL